MGILINYDFKSKPHVISYSAIAVANSLIELSSDMNHMKLHKMLYFCQGWSLALSGRPLFHDEIMVGEFGPIVPVVFEIFRRYKMNKINEGYKGVIPLAENSKALVQSIVEKYGEIEDLNMASMCSHSLAPWSKCKAAGTDIISKELLTAYFKSLIQDT